MTMMMMMGKMMTMMIMMTMMEIGMTLITMIMTMKIGTMMMTMAIFKRNFRKERGESFGDRIHPF